MEKYILNEGDILSKLALIEKHLNGFNSSFYDVSEDFSPRDIISVQKEASRMMKFVGLLHHVACITYTNTEKGTGGNIELDNSDNVFIEINEKYKYDKEKSLAVMAHEICHKVLYVNHLYFPNNRIENELLTDISTIYVGFGKLSLNGCYSESYSNKREWRNNQWIDVTTTHKEYVGYLSLRQFAITYNLVCSIYGVTDDIKKSGLSKIAYNEIISLHPFSHAVYKLDDVKQKLIIVQEQDADLTRCIILMESIIFELKQRIKNDQKKYFNDFVLPFKRNDNNESVQKQIVVAELFAKYSGMDGEKKETSCLFHNFIDDYARNHELNNSILLDIECPCCGFKKQKALKEPQIIFIKCPNCGHMFLWNANEEKKTDSTQYKSKNLNFNRFVKKIKALFKI